MAKKKRGYETGDEDDAPADVGTVWGESTAPAAPAPASAPAPAPEPECVCIDVGDERIYRMSRRAVVWTPGPGAPESATYADEVQVGQTVVDDATGRRFTVGAVSLGRGAEVGGLRLC